MRHYLFINIRVLMCTPDTFLVLIKMSNYSCMRTCVIITTAEHTDIIITQPRISLKRILIKTLKPAVFAMGIKIAI